MQTKAANMAQVAKTQSQNKITNIISKATRRKLVLAHHQLYRAFFLKGLLSGMTIGGASYNAFRIIKAKLSTMDQNNPVTKFLIRLTARKSKRLSKRIMPSRQRDAQIALIPEQREKLTKKIPNWINKSLTIINTISAQYKQNTQSVAMNAPAQTELPTITEHKNRILGFLSVVADARAFALRHQQQQSK